MSCNLLLCVFGRHPYQRLRRPGRSRRPAAACAGWAPQTRPARSPPQTCPPAPFATHTTRPVALLAGCWPASAPTHARTFSQWFVCVLSASSQHQAQQTSWPARSLHTRDCTWQHATAGSMSVALASLPSASLCQKNVAQHPKTLQGAPVAAVAALQRSPHHSRQPPRHPRPRAQRAAVPATP